MAVYLDNSATTKPCPQAVKAINRMLSQTYGNPSSLHRMGIEATKEIISARESIAKALSCEKDEIYFTSGATEANNLAVFGAAYANRRKGNRIVTTAIEHESIIESMRELEKEGFEIIKIQPDSKGEVNINDVEKAINGSTILVSMMYINNETGSVLPVNSLKKIIQRKGAPALIHTDCVQAFGKTEVRPKKLGADLLSITAHKIHGPKGCGALYIKKGARILPRVFGGEQENKIRPGTEASPLIAGFGAAVDAFGDLKAANRKVSKLNEYTREKLAGINGVIINSPTGASPYILNIFIPTFMRSQTIIQELSEKYGIYVSNGSACAKWKKSHVLSAMKLPDNVIDKSIRISFSRESTKEDSDALCGALKDLIEKHPE
ncbi:MAG: cysteine desulfurase [Clostridiales bacterium]|nr:cysteine desulfurase [Clostridiales bacterium]